MLAMAPHRDEGAWKPPIVSASAASGEGIEDLVGRLDAHAEWLVATGERERKRLARARDEISAMAIAELTQRLSALPGEANLEKLAGLVASGKLDPYSAADELING
jgi:LAO/AO transport system kinase